MKKNVIFTIAFVCSLSPIYAMEQQDKPEAIVPNASYAIYEGASGIVGGVPTTSRWVTFYTCDGQSISTIEHKFRFPVIDRMLDGNAPRPRPVDCEVKYWPAIQLCFGLPKGVPGNFILFYDKNRNVIKSLRCEDDANATIQKCGEQLDITTVKEKALQYLKSAKK